MTELNSAAKLCGAACAAVGHCDHCPACEKRKRGRLPNRYHGKTPRDLGMTRKDAWESRRLAQIPKDQFEALLKNPMVHGRHLGTLGMLRVAGLLAPEKPRPPERARAEAIDYLEHAQEQNEWLRRELLENGSESELAHADEIAAVVTAALNTLRCVTPSRSEP